MMDTWNYVGPFENVEPADIPEEWVWERLRARRNQLLAASDFRMVTDAPWDQSAWTQYRQQLRDLPSTITNPRIVDWPQQPTA